MDVNLSYLKEENMSLKKEFIQWATSLSGCDGGNPEADIWLSGIEWGGGVKNTI